MKASAAYFVSMVAQFPWQPDRNKLYNKYKTKLLMYHYD